MEHEYECYKVRYTDGKENQAHELERHSWIGKDNFKVISIEYIEIPTCAVIHFQNGTFNIVFNLNEVFFRPIKKKEKKND